MKSADPPVSNEPEMESSSSDSDTGVQSNKKVKVRSTTSRKFSQYRKRRSVTTMSTMELITDSHNALKKYERDLESLSVHWVNRTKGSVEELEIVKRKIREVIYCYIYIYIYIYTNINTYV